MKKLKNRIKTEEKEKTYSLPNSRLEAPEIKRLCRKAI